MADPLLDIYRQSAYKVRLPRGGAAVIRVDHPLPQALQAWADGREWGFLTAWNPRSQPQPLAVNRIAQRRLRQDLRAHPAWQVHVAAGVGSDGWREPSFWIVGVDGTELAALARCHGQLGWLHGVGSGPARLCLQPSPAAP